MTYAATMSEALESDCIRKKSIVPEHHMDVHHRDGMDVGRMDVELFFLLTE